MYVCVSGAIPMIGQVMSAARGATDAFSGVSGSANHYVCLCYILTLLL